MKAIVYRRYGPPDVLTLGEVETPSIKDDEILVRVHAASVSSGDARIRGFNVPLVFWLPSRLFFGLTGPRNPIPGAEFAGEVETVGKSVSRFMKGDRVFGTKGFGACAEYAARSEAGVMTTIPAGMTYEEAAAVPFGALSALVFLRDMGKIRSGQDVLINGAAGAVGSFAVQLAKHFGAEVTATCSSSKVALVKSLGADHAIDYTREDFGASGRTYDIILDTVGTTSFSRCKGALKPQGCLIFAVFGLTQMLQMLWTSMVGGKKVVCGVADDTRDDLEIIKQLLEAGKIKPVIDRRYPLERTAEAHRYVEAGHKTGSVVITIGQDNPA